MRSAASFVCLDIIFRQATPPYVLDPLVLEVTYAANLLVTPVALVAMTTYFGNLVRRAEDEADQERQRAEGLLRNILPDSIAERLNREPKTIADGFSDLVGFTSFAEEQSAEQVVAGVIGKKKFSYDLWGDTVNLASRMESHGLANRIKVASRTHELLEGRLVLESQGVVEVNGKGQTPTWILTGRKEVEA